MIVKAVKHSMLKYNLCLIKRDSTILLLNRERNQWMGRWNGVGGKLESNEEAREAMLREIQEETGLTSVTLEFKGFLTWSDLQRSYYGGLYFYLGHVPDDYSYPTPRRISEGILDWKHIDWILHPQNLGVPTNLPSCLRVALEDPRCFDYHSIFGQDEKIQKEIISEITPELETNKQLRDNYLKKYLVDLRKLPS